MPNSFNALVHVSRWTTRRSSTTGSTPCATPGSTSSRLPFSLKVLLENLLRHEDGVTVTADDIKALAELGPQGRARPRDRLPAQPGPAPGLHRRARRSSTWPRCATR